MILPRLEKGDLKVTTKLEQLVLYSMVEIWYRKDELWDMNNRLLSRLPISPPYLVIYLWYFFFRTSYFFIVICNVFPSAIQLSPVFHCSCCFAPSISIFLHSFSFESFFVVEFHQGVIFKRKSWGFLL